MPRSTSCALLIVFALVAGLSAEPIHLPIFQKRSTERRLKTDYSSPQLSPRQSSDSTVSSLNAVLYYIPLDIGTPPQTVELVLTTTIADIFIVGIECDACFSAAGASIYDSSKSSSAVNKSIGNPKNATFEPIVITDAFDPITLTTWSFTDTISLGQFTALGADVFQVIETFGGVFGTPIAGFFGLAFQGLSSFNTPPFWQAISQQVSIRDMGLWFTRRGNDTLGGDPEPGGVFTFGGTNTSLYTGDIEFMPVTSNNTYWSLNLSTITVQGHSLSVTPSTSRAAIITGVDDAVWISGPPADVKAIWALVPNSSEIFGSSGTFQFPCSASVNISISFGGRSWSINADDMNLGPVNSNSDQCIGGIVYGNTTSGASVHWSFGLPFLKNVYTVLRQNPPSVGFGELSALGAGTDPQSSVSQSANPTSSTTPTGSDTSGSVSLKHAGWTVLCTTSGFVALALFLEAY
ncbi:aspartic peptidase domain-containing protein [Favolaschia claudopus]|uniref:Aspartic peptidase domain-containing protein n=1 Tax=Favolaschia claudopus TaxID=2862362 RepID=A0AAW0CPR1_9AGAR